MKSACGYDIVELRAVPRNIHMVILTHHTGEPYGILGAQVAATHFTRLGVPSIVVGVKREFSRKKLLAFIDEHYQGKARTIAFSHLCGRKDLFDLISALKALGFTTVLGGPQALQDYAGEPGVDRFAHRFQGFKEIIDIVVQGPVDGVRLEHLEEKGKVFQFPWTADLFLEVDWSNLYFFSETLEKPEIRMAQVLAAVGCPYALKERLVALDPPVSMKDEAPVVSIKSCGCVFCDVSWDKGFQGQVDKALLLGQLRGLPEQAGRKIPFELIDEYPMRTARQILEDAEREDIALSQISLVCRVDAITKQVEPFQDLLEKARERNVRIMFSSIGFESFSDKILGFFNKGITVDEITECVNILRRAKETFSDTLLYRTDEGATHGFIHPTPWDDAETMPEIDRNIFLYRLFDDILPTHSTPLIIHHGSYLGNWIRELEERTGVTFSRDGTWIEWWRPVNFGQAAL